MSARTRIYLHPLRHHRASPQLHRSSVPKSLTYATIATHTTAVPSPPPFDLTSAPPIQRYPPNQPPSHKPPELRKSQLHRSYVSLLRTSPLLLIFQHNNLKASEWAGVRRELAAALRKVSAAHPPPPEAFDPADAVRLQVIQTGIFAAALRVVEHYHPDQTLTEGIHATEQQDAALTHGLSAAAHKATVLRRRGQTVGRRTPLDALMSGPLAVLSFPSVTPAHLAAALSIVAPTPGPASKFAAPKRRAAPGYYELAVQNGLQKLMLLGARVEGKTMDVEGTRWVGGIEGGMDGLRAQLVHTLQSAGMGLATALSGATTSLWATMESRRIDMEGEQTKSDA